MKQKDYNFAQTLLVIAVIAAIIVIGFLLWDQGQSSNGTTTIYQQRQTAPQLTPTPVPKKDNINFIEADFNKISTTQYETQVDQGLTQLGADAAAF